MILEPKQTTIAYRCPACGKSVISVTGVFALTGDMIKLKCDCGGSELVIKNIGDGKIRLTVPCLFCPTPHNFVVSKKMLFNREVFTFPCAYSGVDICFSGSKGAVLKAIEESDKALSELIDDTELAKIFEENGENENSYNDEHIRDMILFVLGDLCEEKKIKCACSDGGDFLVENEIGKVKISCKKCGCSREFFCEESIDTRALLDADSLELFFEKN